MPSRGVDACKTLGGLAQGWVWKIANPQPGPGVGLYPVHDARAFPRPGQSTLAVRPLGRPLLRNRRHARHAAMARFCQRSHPQETPRFSNSVSSRSVFRPGDVPAIPRHSTHEITCASTPRASSQRAPTRKPSRAAGFRRATAIRVIVRPASDRLILPAMHAGAKQPFLGSARSFLARLTLNPREACRATRPARLAHLDDGYDRGPILVQGATRGSGLKSLGWGIGWHSID